MDIIGLNVNRAIIERNDQPQIITSATLAHYTPPTRNNQFEFQNTSFATVPQTTHCYQKWVCAQPRGSYLALLTPRTRLTQRSLIPKHEK